MSYQQFKPHPALSPYIDAYWQVTGEGTNSDNKRILLDCCVDIIVNLGANFVSDGTGFIMKNEKVYLMGTMTRYKETVREAGTYLIGARFKPAAFDHFYKFGPLSAFTDKILEFNKEDIPTFTSLTNDFTNAFDHFFLERLSPAKHSIFPIMDEINSRNGKISVTKLAKKHYTSVRQLQRLFKEHMGIGPKDFINFVRYQFAVQTAHLTNEIKKYTGIAPSEL